MLCAIALRGIPSDWPSSRVWRLLTEAGCSVEGEVRQPLVGALRFANLRTRGDAFLAIAHLNGINVDGAELGVEMARSQPRPRRP